MASLYLHCSSRSVCTEEYFSMIVVSGFLDVNFALVGGEREILVFSLSRALKSDGL